MDLWTNLYIKSVGAIEILDIAFHNLIHKITNYTVEKKCKRLFNPDLTELNNKIVIITGGNAGIGKATAKFFAENGAHVIIACRSLERGNKAAKEIENQMNPKQIMKNSNSRKNQEENSSNNFRVEDENENLDRKFGKIDVYQLDLCSFSSIRKFVQNFKGDFDILICNAGVMVPPDRILSENGLESQFQTNYLGHWLLINLLLEKTNKYSKKLSQNNKRIVMLSSMTHRAGNLNPETDDFSAQKDYEPFIYYAKSKLAVILGVKEFQRRFQNLNLGHVAVACHPGLVATQLADEYFLKYLWPKFMHQFIKFTLGPVLPYILLTAEESCLNVVQAATAPDEISKGKYISNMKFCEPSKKSGDQKLGQDLWQVSEQLTGEQFLKVEENFKYAYA